MAATQAFLIETVLSDKNPRPGVVKVVGVSNFVLNYGPLNTHQLCVTVRPMGC